MTELNVNAKKSSGYERENNPHTRVEPEKKTKIDIAAAMRYNGNNGGSAGAGIMAGVERNFDLGERHYLNTFAEAGIFTNGIDVKAGADYLPKGRNISPVIGAEVKYQQGGRQSAGLSSTLEGMSYSNNIKYSEHQLQFSGKLGIQGQTNNEKFSFGAGLKTGYKVALDNGYRIQHDYNMTENNNGVVTEKRASVAKTYRPSSGMNGGFYAESEFKLGAGLSLNASGEYTVHNKEAKVGIKYTF